MPKILLVDDDPSVCAFMADLLETKAYDVVSANSGKKAIDFIQENQVDVVILDIFMPDQDGIETMREIRIHNPEVKIVAMCGYVDQENGPLQYIESLGANATLQKPFENDVLFDVVERCIA